MKEHFFDIRKIPKTWDELTPLQMERVCGILHGSTSKIDAIQWLAVALMGIEGGRAYLPIDEIAEATQFLLGGSDRTQPPFGSISLGYFGRAYPPAKALENITFGEWVKADSAFTAYIETARQIELDRLCACLYRPRKLIWERISKRYDGDPREAFNSNALDRQALRWKSVPLARKLAVLAYFAGSKAKIADTFTKVFKKGSTEKKQRGTGWLKALDRYAGNIAQYDTVLTSRLYLVLFSMNEMARDAEELKKQTT